MSTRPSRETERPLGPSRAAAQQRAAGRAVPQKRKRTWLWAALALGLLLAVAALAWSLTRGGQSGTIAGVTELGTMEQGHTEEPVTYPQVPPAGGTHHPQWQNCGIYDEPVGNNYAVHSLEHGAVWITYRPDLPAEQVEQLRNLVRGRGHALLSPYPDLPSPVVASAWGLQLTVDSAGDGRLAQFLDKYERGRQTPEPGASCRGGVGDPIAR